MIFYLYSKFILWYYNLQDWKIEYNYSHSYGGLTDYEKKTIFMSKYALTRYTFWRKRELLLHEVAHALVPDVQYAAHGKEWRKKCKEIGGTGKIYCQYFSRDSDYQCESYCSDCNNVKKHHRRYSIWCKCGKYLHYYPNQLYYPLC